MIFLKVLTCTMCSICSLAYWLHYWYLSVFVSLIWPVMSAVGSHFAGKGEFPVRYAGLHPDRQKPARGHYRRYHSRSAKARDHVQEFPRTRSRRILLVATSQVLEKQGDVMWRSVVCSLLHSSNVMLHSKPICEDYNKLVWESKYVSSFLVML